MFHVYVYYVLFILYLTNRYTQQKTRKFLQFYFYIKESYLIIITVM